MVTLSLGNSSVFKYFSILAMKPTTELLKKSQEQLSQAELAIQDLEKLLVLMNKRFDELNGMVIGLGQVLTLEERKRDDDRKREEDRLRLEEEHLDKFEQNSRLSSPLASDPQPTTNRKVNE